MNEDLIAKLRAVRVKTPQEVMAQRELALDESRLVGHDRNQDRWTKLLSEFGNALASMPDYYRWFTQLEDINESDPGRVRKLLETFRGEITARRDGEFGSENRLITSTRVVYSGINYGAKVYHYYDGGEKRSLSYIDDVEYGYGDREKVISVNSVRWFNEGKIHTTFQHGSLPFLQALFDTRDSAQKILRTLEFVFRYSRDSIFLNTRPYTGDQREGVANFEIREKGFIVNANNDVALKGHGRGVRYNE